ncbi:MAG TPA: PD-(D/E)XK nuclease family protein [Candidatus Acidoferrum sp.]|nr:PD-(D/E)XK nuclease family protein [Candidatus Acidoferrum sp.]
MNKPISGGGRPKAYKLADGTRVPGVTTITGRFKDSGGLIRWAYNCGRDGIDMDRVRDDAADTGTIIHAWIDDYIHDRPRSAFPMAPDQSLKQAESALTAFLDWATQVNLEVLETETPLVSEQYRFGGTFDALAKVAGRVVLLDWKSSNGVYPDYIAQVAAYRQLLRERGTLVDGAQLCRFGKEFADFHHHSYPNDVLDIAWECFELYRRAYDLDSRLKKVAA